MTNPPRDPEVGDGSNVPYEREPRIRIPRWVKMAGIGLAVLVLLIVVVLLTGVGGEHGPRRHGPPGDGGGHRPGVEMPQPGGPGGHAPPAGGHG